MDADVAGSVERTFGGTPREVAEEDLLVLTDAMRISAEMMDAPTAETTQEDAAEIIEGKIIEADRPRPDDIAASAVQMRQSVLRRQISRMGQQYAALCKDSKLAKHYDTDTFKVTRVVGGYSSISMRLAFAVGILAKLAGLY